MLTPYDFASPVLGESRKVWIQAAESAATAVVIVLDAEIYIDRVKAPAILEEWQMKQATGLNCVYVSHKDSASRHLDYTCSEAYADFLVKELLPWIAQTVGRHDRVFLAGLSLSGLEALFTALRFPGVFAGVLAQSPSAWWRGEWLAASLDERSTPSERCWISVGTKELQSNVSHAPSGLRQSVNQLDSVRRLCDALQNAGHVVRPTEFDGGHDPVCWAEELSPALTWLLGEEVPPQA